MTFSFIHISDIHLGRPFSSLNEYSNDLVVKDLYKEAVNKAFFNAINFAITKNVDFVLIAGDTFDSEEQDFESKLVLKDGLKKLDDANIKVYAICGNHDPLISYNNVTFNFDESSNIKIVGLNSEINEQFIVNDKENNPVAIIHALSFRDSKMEENPCGYFKTATIEDKKLFNIGLLHCDLDADKSSPYAPCRRSELYEKNYDYWALGHIHIPDLNETNVCYAGTLQGRNTKETGPHGIKYIKVDNCKIIKNQFVPIDIIRFENIDIDLSSTLDSTVAATYIEEKINDFINKELNSNCELFFIKLKLIGSVRFYSEIDEEFFNVISERLKINSYGKVCISEIYNNLTAKVDETLLKEDDGIAGILYSTVQDDNNLDVVFNENIKALKKLVNDCYFSKEEAELFEKDVKIKAKEICNNLCNQVYGNESKEDIL